MIYLTEQDILSAASVDEMLDTIEASLHLYEKKEFHMPQRLHVDHQDDVLLLMPCFTNRLIVQYWRKPVPKSEVISNVQLSFCSKQKLI